MGPPPNQGHGGSQTPVADTDDPAETLKSWVWKRELACVFIGMATAQQFL